MLTDADGNRLIDFAGGIGVVNTGHRHAGVVAAVREQLDRFTHVCFPVSTYEPYVELAERLNRLTPGTHEKRTFFVNSGAEAVENAVKVARAFTGRQAVVCFEHGFHGRTNLAMALTSKVMPYKKGFGPFAPEVYRIPFPYCYRCDAADRRAGRTGQCCMASRRVPRELFSATVDPGSVAAIIMELELGEGGSSPRRSSSSGPSPRSRGSTGSCSSPTRSRPASGGPGGCSPASTTGWCPTSSPPPSRWPAACRSRPSPAAPTSMEAPQVGGLGGTYGGNPLACAAALAVLDAMEAERIPERAQQAGDRVRARFCEWATRYACIGDVRGLGAMIGLELVTDRDEPDAGQGADRRPALRRAPAGSWCC